MADVQSQCLKHLAGTAEAFALWWGEGGRASEVGTRLYLVRVPLPFSPTPRTLTHALAIPAIIIHTYFSERQVEADGSSFL